MAPSKSIKKKARRPSDDTFTSPTNINRKNIGFILFALFALASVFVLVQDTRWQLRVLAENKDDPNHENENNGRSSVKSTASNRRYESNDSPKKKKKIVIPKPESGEFMRPGSAPQKDPAVTRQAESKTELGRFSTQFTEKTKKTKEVEIDEEEEVEVEMF